MSEVTTVQRIIKSSLFDVDFGGVDNDVIYGLMSYPRCHDDEALNDTDAQFPPSPSPVCSSPSPWLSDVHN